MKGVKLVLLMALACFSFTLGISDIYAGSGSISANPAYCVISSGTGTTTISWSTSGYSTAEVYVSHNGAADQLFAQAASGSEVVTWIQAGHAYDFKLFANTDHTELLSCVTVLGITPNSGKVWAFPKDVNVPQGGQGTTTITWATNGFSTAEVYVSHNGGTETLFARAASGSVSAGWIQNGHTYDFNLYAGTGHSQLLSTVRVTGNGGGSGSDYLVGPNYHARNSSFSSGAFLRDYHISSVRNEVKSQLQGMANRGAGVIKTNMWMVVLSGSPSEKWKWHFPPTTQELNNLRTYAQDVAAIQASDGHRLKLDLTMLWLWAADYTHGSPGTTLGYNNLTASQFTSKVVSTYQSIINKVYNVNRPDGQKVVGVVHLDGEVMIGAKANQDWFVQTHYPGFVSYCNSRGLTPSIYFFACSTEGEVLDNNFQDHQYPILNGHRSMYWVYRSLKFMKDNGLQIPGRIDFSSYVQRVNSTYDILVQRIFDDADAVLPSLGCPKSYAVAETYYFTSNSEREALGAAFAAQRLVNGRLKQTTFWTTPDGGGSGVHVGYPFEIEDYLP